MPYPVAITHRDIAEALRPSRSFYPNIETIAYFRPNSLTIHFERLTRAAYSAIRQGQMTSDDRAIVQTVSHELTHWSDQVSSVWGQEYLVKLFEAHAAARANREEWFYKVVELFDDERRILFPLYYHTVDRNSRQHDARTPWRIEFSAGHEFAPDGHINSVHPIFFVKFGDSGTGAIGRVGSRRGPGFE
jgi:hypothetical protein